jgi:hypothetical protein
MWRGMSRASVIAVASTAPVGEPPDTSPPGAPNAQPESQGRVGAAGIA